jgi:hypothetical protein
MSQTESPSATYARGAERVREAAKWLLGTFGAIATVLVAGSQLSSIGSLKGGGRLVVAILAAAIALIGLGIAAWLILDIMLPSRASLRDVVLNEPTNKLAERYPELLHGLPTVEKLREEYTAALKKRLDVVKKNYHFPQGASDDEVKAAANWVIFLGQTVGEVEGVTAYLALESKLRNPRRRLFLFLLAAVIAGGIIIFAWAANPPEPIVEGSQELHAAFDLADAVFL